MITMIQMRDGNHLGLINKENYSNGQKQRKIREIAKRINAARMVVSFIFISKLFSGQISVKNNIIFSIIF